MAGNTWEFINDWYGQDYYSVSPYRNPTGPTTGFIMPDGKPYRGMRGGNWYNGQWGHSRVSNRNPTYYRGPQDPNHPWYHVSFRVARYVYSSSVGIKEINETPGKFILYQNYPNPFNPSTNIKYQIPNSKFVTLKVYDVLGKEVETLVNEMQSAGTYEISWNARNGVSAAYSSGIYYYKLVAGNYTDTKKMILIK